MSYINQAKEIFDLEINELINVKNRIDTEFDKAIDLIYNSLGKVVVTGIGKSGIIGRKISSSLASTGTSSVFMNSAEGLHGDLGIINSNDVVLAISNSGNTKEVLDLIESIKRIGANIISMTGNINSELAINSDIVIDVSVQYEACPMNLAPTTSTTATLLMGDALVVTLIRKRNFKPENFALYHPGGTLGRKLLTRVKDLMNTNIPCVKDFDNLNSVISEITSKRLGMTMVYNIENDVVGLITDGDLRRCLIDGFDNINCLMAKDIMTKDFIKIEYDKMANYALEIMDINNITFLPVYKNKSIVGIISIHDLYDFK